MSLGFLGLVGGTVLVSSLLGACAAPTAEPAGGSASSVTQGAFDRNSVIDDKSMRDGEALSAADVQKFLDKTPWGTRSVLAKYTENGKTAAEIMVSTAQAHGINPLELLVRVQMEQGLVSKTAASASTVSLAFGCGCPHSAVCSDKYRGFGNQAECAAGTMRRAMDQALTSTGTVSGWARNKSKATEDGLTILPKNAATAALYTYTPWVGEAGGGKAGVGGASLHAQVWDRFAESVSYGAWATTPADTTSTAEAPDAGAAAPDASVDPTDPPEGDDAGTDPTPDPSADTDAGSTTADAGPKGEGSGKSGDTIPEDGSEDGDIIGAGSTPPTSNAAPPSTKGKSRPEELPQASEEELASKSKASAGGCSTTGHQDGTSNGLLIAAAAGLALVGSRRRRSPASR